MAHSWGCLWGSGRALGGLSVSPLCRDEFRRTGRAFPFGARVHPFSRSGGSVRWSRYFFLVGLGDGLGEADPGVAEPVSWEGFSSGNCTLQQISQHDPVMVEHNDKVMRCCPGTRVFLCGHVFFVTLPPTLCTKNVASFSQPLWM